MQNIHQLKEIKVSGFKSIKELDLKLENLNVLIGANGAGKSNFIQLFRFMRFLVNQQLQEYTARKGGADKLLHYGSKETDKISVALTFKPNYYKFELAPSIGDSLFFLSETCAFDMRDGKLYQEHINTNRHESDLINYSHRSQQNVSKYVYNVLSKWQVYHFHDTSDTAKIKKQCSIHDNEYLFEDAANLAAFLYAMHENSPRHYERIIKIIQLVMPLFKDFYFRPLGQQQDKLLLMWRDKHSETIFTADDLSDGSLRFICLATVLLQPYAEREMPRLMLFDEPELGLHPAAIQILGGLLRKAAHFSQIILSTQSAELVSMFQPNEVIVVENKKNAYSTFQRLDNEGLNEWLKNYSLGEIWEKNIIGGLP